MSASNRMRDRQISRQVRYFCERFEQADMKPHTKQAAGLLYRCLAYAIENHPDEYDGTMLALGRKAIQFGYDVGFVAKTIAAVCSRKNVALP